MKSNLHSTSRPALLLIDLQNDFVEGGSLAVSDGIAVVDVANRIIPKFDLVVATQDWHPLDHQSFASQHRDLDIGQMFDLNGLQQIAWPDHCVQGSWGAAFVERLNQSGIHHVIQKGCRGVELNVGDIEQAIEEMKQAGVELTHSDQIQEKEK